jgi:hypothetical protein
MSNRCGCKKCCGHSDRPRYEMKCVDSINEAVGQITAALITASAPVVKSTATAEVNGVTTVTHTFENPSVTAQTQIALNAIALMYTACGVCVEGIDECLYKKNVRALCELQTNAPVCRPPPVV